MPLFFNDLMNETSAEIDTGLEIEYTPYAERLESYFVPISFVFIFIVGVLGNGTLVLIFMKEKSMRNIPNIFVMSLVLSDLLLIVFCVPVLLLIYIVGTWPLGTIVCKLSETIRTMSVGVSVFTLTALSAERYFVVVKPFRKLQIKRLTVSSVILIWMMAFVFSLPSAIFSNVHETVIDENLTVFQCSPFPDITYLKINAQYYSILNALIYYMFPFVIISCFYILMAYHLYTSSQKVRGEFINKLNSRKLQKRRHLAGMVVTLAIAFFICFFPRYLFDLWFNLNPNSLEEYNDYWHAVQIIGYWLSLFHSCVNPIALYIVSETFQQYFKKYLFFCNNSLFK